MHFQKSVKNPAALFEIVAPSRGIVILGFFVNNLQDKCIFIFVKFVGYNQRNLPKDLKELLEKNWNLNPSRFVSGQRNHKKVDVFNFIPLQKCI